MTTYPISGTRPPKIDAHWDFDDDTAGRDEFIDINFPDRKCMGMPGHFKVAGGDVFVFCGHVQYVGRERDFR